MLDCGEPDCDACKVKRMEAEIDTLRAMLHRIEAAARAVLESREEIHSLERGEGYLVCGAYLDDLRKAVES